MPPYKCCRHVEFDIQIIIIRSLLHVELQHLILSNDNTRVLKNVQSNTFNRFKCRSSLGMVKHTQLSDMHNTALVLNFFVAHMLRSMCVDLASQQRSISISFHSTLYECICVNMKLQQKYIYCNMWIKAHLLILFWQSMS